MQKLTEVIANSPIIIHKDQYCVIKTDKIVHPEKHFMVTRDAEEVTVITLVTNRSLIPKVLDIRSAFYLIEFQVAVPFEGVGFLATISKALADAGLNILVVSTFSRDYLLLKDEDLDIGLRTLSKVGFDIQNRK